MYYKTILYLSKERVAKIMNETINVINSRRSIRKYKPEQISDAELQQIMNSAIYAPSAMNQQKWNFTVIQNREMLDRMVGTIKENIISGSNEFLAKRASDPEYNTFYNAPTVILISADEKAHFYELDCGLAAENITLAAESLNIGSCVITSSGFLFMSDKGRNLQKELGIPDGYKHVCTVTLGYKENGNPAAPPRNRDVINYIK
jgi:nitroreductase